jgi:hypothetical protein
MGSESDPWKAECESKLSQVLSSGLDVAKL